MRKIEAAIDLGNRILKAVTVINKKEVYYKLPNLVQIDKTINPKSIEFNLNNNIVYLGVGNLNNNKLKHTRSYLLEQTLTCICGLAPGENSISVDLKMGLPPEQLFNDSYLEEFKSNFKLKEKITFAHNRVQKTVIINSLEVFAEGYSGFVHISDKIDTKQDILSIDFGGGTIDLCDYQYDYEDSMYYPNNIFTVETGSIDFANAIATNFNRVNNADIDLKYIDTLLTQEIDTIEYKGIEYNLKDYISVLEPMAHEVINKITNKYGKLDNFVLVGLGGGYKTFNRITKHLISKQIELDENTRLFANALGYLEQ
ncbi:MAG: hypothetical protein ACRDB0_04990 [Paraclostridium sp.]